MGKHRGSFPGVSPIFFRTEYCLPHTYMSYLLLLHIIFVRRFKYDVTLNFLEEHQSVSADSFESNRPESKRVPFSSPPTALFCKHPPEVLAGDIRIGTHRRMKGEVTSSKKAHVAQSNTARVIIEVCLEVIFPPGCFKPLACCVRRK